MKHPNLPVKRRPAKKGAIRTLFVNVRSKRHRAATATAPFLAGAAAEGDVPNVGVARALGVIVAIHVVAVVGIFVHSKYFEPKNEAKGGAPAQMAVGGRDDRFKLGPNEQGIMVKAGESYNDIANKYHLDVKELQEANGNAELRVGMILRQPDKAPNVIKAMAPDELAKAREGNPLLSLNTQVTTSPPPMADVVREAPMVEVPVKVRPMVGKEGEKNASKTSASNHEKTPPKATLVKDKISSEKIGSSASSPTTEKKATASNTTPNKKAGSKVTVKSGDTLWSIAKANGTSANALMKANGIKDAGKLRSGMELTIPKN